jgi:hypothetical protein
MAVAARIRAKKLPSRLAGRRSPNLAGAIEGTIIATAVVAGLDKAEATPVRALLLLFATGTFFWLAHVYALLLAARIHGRHRMRPGDIGRVMALEWPLLQAGSPLSLPLLAGSIGILSDDVSVSLALLVGVLMLVAWGVLFARREGHRPGGILVAAFLNGLLGLFIVALKAALP